jgi:hypothetical protein
MVLMCIRWVMAAFVLFLPMLAHAERATERYAPTQLGVAHDFLDRARAAASQHDYATAGKLAWQAQVDARIAWGMTDAGGLRAEAAAITADATALTRSLTITAAAAAAGR